GVRLGRGPDAGQGPGGGSWVAVVCGQAFHAALDDVVRIEGNSRLTAGKSLSGRPQFFSNTVEVLLALLQQTQAFLHHIFVALIFAALQLLLYKLFKGWDFWHAFILLLVPIFLTLSRRVPFRKLPLQHHRDRNITSSF